MKVVCLIQARRNNSRLPNKVLEFIGSKPMLAHVVERVQAIAERFSVAVITPPQDADIHPLTVAPSCPEDDVLQRHLLAARELKADAVMRITSDCPFIDPFEARHVLEVFATGHYDYVANDLVKTYPDGLGVEMMTTEALEYAHEKSPPDDPDRVHCTPYIIRHLRGRPCSHRGNPQGYQLFEGLNIRCPVPTLSSIKLSVDTPDDLHLARAIHTLHPASFRMVDTLVAYRKVKNVEAEQSTR